MLSPAAMMIEAAADALPNVKQSMRDSQQRELSSFGDVRAQKLGASGLSDDFRKGYELGLQTARTVLAGSPLLALSNIKPGDVF